MNGSPFHVKFEEATEETKTYNQYEGAHIINYIRNKVEEIKLFIDEKTKALNIDERN